MNNYASSSAPRILVLSPTPTWPRDYGNRKRVHAVCSRLKARGAHLTFLFYPWECEWIDGTPHGAHHDRALLAMARQWDALHVCPVTLPGHTRPTHGPDHSIDEWWDQALENALHWLFRFRRFDMLLVNYPYLSRAFELAPKGVLRVLDTHDRFSGRRQYLERQGIAPEFFHLDEAGEATALHRADVVWAIKDEEAAFFRTLSATPVLTMPHRDVPEPEEDAAVTPRPDEGMFRVGFLGARNSINRANCEAFLRAFLPAVETSGAAARMVLAGTVCLDLDAWRDHPLVEFLGPVPSVDAFYSRVDLVAAPIGFSTGLKIKVIEALDRDVPVVALAHAMEGIPTSHALHGLGSVEETAAACLRAAADPVLLKELREAGAWSVAELERRITATLDETLARIGGR